MSMIEAALRQALRSKCRQKVGAVLCAGGRVLAASPNIKRNDPVIDLRHATFHAEEAVLRRVTRPAGATLYVARVSASGLPALAKPCPRCQIALASAQVRRVYFTVDRKNTEQMHPMQIGSESTAHGI
ncbi:hypothetical protein [Streptomyces sp. NPDC088847]|uniref:hypothetical protein n=1 Tax=Streptomyces sp. NPDC088847 TaxID=3365909 RepID=UPI00381CD3A0